MTPEAGTSVSSPMQRAAPRSTVFSRKEAALGECFHRFGVVAAALVLVLCIGVGCGAAKNVAGAGTSFRDLSGDVQGGAGPDLTRVSVSQTASTVTFGFRFAKAPPLGVNVKKRWVDMLLVLIDVPPRGMKRVAGGWSRPDYFVGSHGTDTTGMLVKAGKTKQSSVIARPKVVVSGRTLSFSVSRSTLGNPAWIEFTVAAGRETSKATGGGSDSAPNSGTFHYALKS